MCVCCVCVRMCCVCVVCMYVVCMCISGDSALLLKILKRSATSKTLSFHNKKKKWGFGHRTHTFEAQGTPKLHRRGVYKRSPRVTVPQYTSHLESYKHPEGTWGSCTKCLACPACEIPETGLLSAAPIRKQAGVRFRKVGFPGVSFPGVRL